MKGAGKRRKGDGVCLNMTAVCGGMVWCRNISGRDLWDLAGVAEDYAAGLWGELPYPAALEAVGAIRMFTGLVGDRHHRRQKNRTPPRKKSRHDVASRQGVLPALLTVKRRYGKRLLLQGSGRSSFRPQIRPAPCQRLPGRRPFPAPAQASESTEKSGSA